MPEFDQVQTSLLHLDATIDASEAHGTLCGLLMGQQDFSRWMEFTLEEETPKGDVLAKEQLQVLQSVYEETREQLNADDMSLAILLPHESEEFALRLIALGNWCQGFLYGLAVHGEKVLHRLSEQGRECMNDLLEISQLSHDEEQSEESENVYSEIVEHVRLSVIYMHEEMNPVSPAPSLQ
jgi:hypothetical protein